MCPASASTRCSTPPTAGTADFGVVPVENNTEGVVTRSLDLLLHSPLHIVGEISLLVRHHLLRLSNSLDGIEVVLAHPQALAQCQGWLNKHLPKAERRAVSSNAEGARLAATNPAWAGIASERAGSEFGLHIAAHAIQDDAFNRTRFAVVCLPQVLEAPQASGRDCVSLVVSVPNRPGRRARHPGAAQAARRVDDPLRVAARALGPVGILFLHRRAGPSLAAPRGRRAEGPAGASARSTRCWAPTPSATETTHHMFEQLGLIGCGLMGGSFALALKRAGLVKRVVGYSKSPSTTERARPWA